MRIIFSKDRPAQLDLILTSLERNAPREETLVLYRADLLGDYALGYGYVIREHPGVTWQAESDFSDNLRLALLRAGETVTFLCDDDVLYRPVPDSRPVLEDERVFALSWRLGTGNVNQSLPWPLMEEDELLMWSWAQCAAHDFGYPASIDGHTFRARDVRRLIGAHSIPNPTMLETILAHRADVLEHERPLLACYPEQALVGVPVNRVSDQSGVAHGERFPATAEDLNRRFLGGERIDLDALDFSGVNACHVELEFAWRERVTA